MEEKTKVMRVSTDMLNTLRELSERTKIDMIVLLDDIFAQIQKQLDLMEPNKRLVFMADFYNKDAMPKTIVRLSDALASSFDEIPQELHKDILEKFGYDERFRDLPKSTEQPKLTENPVQPKKLTHCEQIQKQYEEEKDKQ